MRWPGFDTRFRPVIRGSPSAEYFKRNFKTFIFPACPACLPVGKVGRSSSAVSVFSNQPCFSKTVARLALSFEYGKTTSCFFISRALRILVNMSEIGSVIIWLPARLNNSRDLAFGGHLAETNAANIKISHIPALAAAAPASSHQSGGKFGVSLRFYNL